MGGGVDVRFAYEGRVSTFVKKNNFGLWLHNAFIDLRTQLTTVGLYSERNFFL